MTAIKELVRAVQLGTVAGLMAVGAMLLGATPLLADGEEGYTLKKSTYVQDTGWANHWLVRARATYLLMRDDVDNAHVNSGFTSAPLGVTNGVLNGNGADVTNQLIPELDISYFLTNNIAVEVICCATKHSVDATGALANTINGVVAALTGAPGANNEVASTWAIPATILFQYHFDMGHGLKPYVGAGPTYGIFVGEKVGGALQPVATGVDVQNTWGFTLQAGTDIAVGGNWFLNVDAKYMYLEPDVTWAAAANLNGATGATSLIAEDLQLDPWILSVGLGYKF